MARKENTLTRWIPGRLRNPIKALLQHANSLTTPQMILNPSLSAKLYAYRPYSNEFVVRGADFANVEKDADGIPVPPRELRLGEPSAEEFCVSGREDFDQMVRVLEAAQLPIAGFSRILDFGCSSGRMIRCLYQMARQSEVWGVDLAAEHMFWCQQYLSPPFHFAAVTSSPHLPFEDRYFDFVYAGSVFTHLDDLADAWFLELRRVLKAGGHAYVTVHDSDTLRHLEQNRERNPWFAQILQSKAFVEFNRGNGRMFTVGRSMMSQVFYDTDYLVSHVGSLYEVRSITNKVYRGFQTGLLLRKRFET
jgi:SAM-dependent methyltransferase